MNDSANVGGINIHGVTKENIKCIVRQYDNFTAITLDFGLTSVFFTHPVMMWQQYAESLVVGNG